MDIIVHFDEPFPPVLFSVIAPVQQLPGILIELQGIAAVIGFSILIAQHINDAFLSGGGNDQQSPGPGQLSPAWPSPAASR